MRRLAPVGLASLSTLLCFGILAGCGDNTAKRALTVMDGGPDGDAASDRVDGSPESGTDTNNDIGEVGIASCTGVAFTDPLNNAMLGAGDDASGDACADGFQYTVKVASPQSGAGVQAMLSGKMGTTPATVLATANVAGGVLTFTNVRIPTGMTTLSVTIGGMACTPTAVVTVDCSLPTVKIIAPEGSAAPFSDKSKNLLAATATQALKDLSAATANAQTDVIACTNKMGSAKLYAGHMGDAMLMQVGAAVSTVAADPADNCDPGYSFVAKFLGVTVPESIENADGTLKAATALTVSVTAAASPAVTGTSDEVDLWVDTVGPTLTEKTPTPLCGSTQNAPGTFTSNVAFDTSVVSSGATWGVTLGITNGTSMVPAIPAPTYAAGAATFANVMFPQNLNIVVATATEPSGNAVTLAPPAGMTSCTVTVGVGPIITFVTPPSGSKLCAVGNSSNGCLPDGNMAVPGWQNDITVSVTAAGVPQTTGSVSFVINNGAPQTVTLSASGTATLSGSGIPEGVNVPVTVTTSAIAGLGVGTATATYNVDTLPPAVPTALTAMPLDRRQTSFTLGWTAPLDQGQPTVAGYNIHVKKLDPATMNPCGTEVKEVNFTTTPKAATMAETAPATGLLIETDYCFTVAATDAVGNVSANATAMGRANFNTTTLMVSDSATQVFGNIADGTGDFGAPGAGGLANDRLSDLIVGPQNGQNAYLFFGRSTGFGSTPDVVFTGPASRRFGAGLANAGDLDGDGLSDIAISAPGLTATDPAAVYIFSRKNATWAVGGGWPATLDYTQATYTITPDASYNGTFFGLTLARMGNFTGTGRDDLAIGAYLYDMGTGTDAGRVVVVKGSDAFSSITLPDANNTIVIDGEAAGDRLGRGIQVLVDNTLVVSSYNSTGGAGKLYAFKSPLAATVVAGTMTASDISIYGAGNGNYGTVLSTLGALGTSPAVITSSATGAGGNFVDVQIAAAGDGTFVGAKGSAVVPTVRFISSTTPTVFGAINISGVVSGSGAAASFIGGDAIPDLVLAGQGDPTNAIYVVSGANIATMTGTVDLAGSSTPGVVVLKNKLPAGWTAYGRGSLILDLNGDGYADIAIAESGTNKPGRALILW